MYIMTFLQFQKELYYISEGIILKNSQKDLRRCEGFQKVLYSVPYFRRLEIFWIYGVSHFELQILEEMYASKLEL